jgi:hypothetical protein
MMYLSSTPQGQAWSRGIGVRDLLHLRFAGKSGLNPIDLSSGVRSRTALVVSVSLLLSIFISAPLAIVGAESANAVSGKVTICHRTHSVTNPYRRITISGNAVSERLGRYRSQ